MDQRIKLIGDWLQGGYSKSELARHYGLSRPTLDKWLARYEAQDLWERAREGAIPHDRDPPPETSVHRTLNRRKPQPKLRHRPRVTLLQSADNAKVMG
jgi:transposase-like protein